MNAPSSAGDPDLQVVLTGLNARHPVEMMAALGALAAANHGRGPREPAWRLMFRPAGPFRVTPILTTEHHKVDAVTRLAAALAADREAFASSRVLQSERIDCRVSPAQLMTWASDVLHQGIADDAAMLRGLIGTDPLAPRLLRERRGGVEMLRTPLIFTAGQQRFLRQVERLRQITPAEAMIKRLRLDPTTETPDRDAAIPSLRWEARANRQAALMATMPASTPYEGEAGLEWLAWRSLRFFPVTDGLTHWYAVDRRSGRQFMRWPLWAEPRSPEEAAWAIMWPSRIPDRIGTVRRHMDRTEYGYGFFLGEGGDRTNIYAHHLTAEAEFDRAVERFRTAAQVLDDARWRRDRAILWAKRRGMSEMEMHRRSGWSRTLIRGVEPDEVRVWTQTRGADLRAAKVDPPPAHHRYGALWRHTPDFSADGDLVGDEDAEQDAQTGADADDLADLEVDIDGPVPTSPFVETATQTSATDWPVINVGGGQISSEDVADQLDED